MRRAPMGAGAGAARAVPPPAPPSGRDRHRDRGCRELPRIPLSRRCPGSAGAAAPSCPAAAAPPGPAPEAGEGEAAVAGRWAGCPPGKRAGSRRAGEGRAASARGKRKPKKINTKPPSPFIFKIVVSRELPDAFCQIAALHRVRDFHHPSEAEL